MKKKTIYANSPFDYEYKQTLLQRVRKARKSKAAKAMTRWPKTLDKVLAKLEEK